MSDYRDLGRIDGGTNTYRLIDDKYRSQVYMLTHDGAGLRLPYEKRAFISFTWGGKFIEDFNLIATVNGDRMQRQLYANFTDNITQSDVFDGQIYWKTHFDNNSISFNLTTDYMLQEQLDEFKAWFKPGRIEELVLAEHPNRAILARVSSPPEYNMLAFEEHITRKINDVDYTFTTAAYRGDITLEFDMDEPFWYSLQNIFDRIGDEPIGDNLLKVQYEDSAVVLNNRVRVVRAHNEINGSFYSTIRIMGKHSNNSAVSFDALTPLDIDVLIPIGSVRIEANTVYYFKISRHGSANELRIENGDLKIGITANGTKLNRIQSDTIESAYILDEVVDKVLDNENNLVGLNAGIEFYSDESCVCNFYFYAPAGLTFTAYCKTGLFKGSAAQNTSSIIDYIPRQFHSWINANGIQEDIMRSNDALKIMFEDKIPVTNMLYDVDSQPIEMIFGSTSLIVDGGDNVGVQPRVGQAEIDSSLINIVQTAEATGSDLQDITACDITANNPASKAYFYYGGNAPCKPRFTFYITPTIEDNINGKGYIIQPFNSINPTNLKTYNTIIFRSQEKHEFRFTTPSILTGYNQAIKVFKTISNTDTKETVRDKLRNNVKHYLPRAFAIEVLNNAANLTVSNLIDEMIKFLATGNSSIGYTTHSMKIDIDSNTGRVVSTVYYHTYTYRNDTENFSSIDENAGDMIKSDYPIIVEQNRPDNNGFIQKWTPDKPFYSHIIYADIDLSNINLSYKFMYL